jgi:hypothetical protein
MVAMNVGELRIPLSLYTGEMRIQASQAKDILADVDAAAAKLKKELSGLDAIESAKRAFNGAMENPKLLAGVSIGESGDLKSIEDRRRISDDIIASIRQQQAEAQRARIDEGAALRFQLLTEQEKHVLRKQSDLEHLEALRRAGALTDSEMQKLSGQAGRLGLGNIAGDNNMKNRGFQGAMMAQQIGFGIQDFSSQITNSKNMVDGLGRGIMAVSNNVQMLGAAFGPTGLAITAIGGAVAGIVLPAFIKWVTNAEQLEKEAAKIEKHFRSIAELSVFKAEVDASKPDKIIKDEERLKEQLTVAQQAQKIEEDRTKEQRKQRENMKLMDEQFIKDETDRALALGETNPLIVGPHEKQIAQLNKELDQSDKVIREQWEKEREAATKLADIGPQVAAAQAKLKEEADQKRLDKNTKSDLAAAGKVLGHRLKDEMKAEEEIQKFQQHGLEKFGTDREKLDSKHAKEEEELGDKLILHPDRDLALEALKAQQDVEVQKLLIDKEEDRLKKLGKPAEMSAGVDVASAEGIRAVNRAMTGFSSIDWEKQNLELMKKQTMFLEQIARDKTKVVALSP